MQNHIECKHKLITKVAFFRFGVNRFTESVNLACRDGWHIEEVSIVKNWLRIICFAHLVKHNK